MAHVEITLMTSTKGQFAVFKLSGYLGADRFGVYRACLDGARFDSSTRTNWAPVAHTLPILHRLKEAGFEATLAPDLRQVLQALTAQKRLFADAAKDRVAAIDEGLKAKGMSLYPFQKVGAAWLAPQTAALLADEMGCVDGNATVYVRGKGKDWTMTLAEFFSAFTSDVCTPWEIKSFCGDDGVTFHPVRSMRRMDEQEVVEVVTDESVVRLTPDHEVATNLSPLEGWTPAGSLKEGDLVWFAGRRSRRPKQVVVKEVRKLKSPAVVYDLVCADPHRNFVANGIIVHNCGKTVQVLAAVPAGAPLLVVCPSVLKGTWRAEAAKWRPDIRSVTVLQGRGSFRWPDPGEMVVINYDVLPNFDELYPNKMNANTSLVFDEAHALKNHKAKRTVRARALSSHVREHGGRTWALTATPLLNEPSELWAVLQAIGCAQAAFGSYKDFFDLCGGALDKWGGVRWSASVDSSVATRVQRVSLRRERKDVLPELPEKTYDVIEVEVDRSTKKIADSAWAALAKAGVNLQSAEALVKATNGSAITLEMVSAARAALVQAKIPSMLEFVESFEDQGEPLVVFSRHRGPIDALEGRPGWATITGDNSKDAQRTAELFQAGHLKGIAATIQAGGVGITLTRAAHALFVDLDWTPALNAQAEDRICRIGQSRGVIIHRMVANHTMDSHVADVVTKKVAIIERVVESSASRDGDPVNAEGELAEGDLQQLFVEAREETVRARPEYVLPLTPRQAWIARALERLTELDPDRAAAMNGVGWNKADGGMGKALTEVWLQRGALTRKQWALAERLTLKYWRQVGAVPQREEGDEAWVQS